MKRIAVIGAVLENPRQSQNAFNDTVSEFRGIIRGRMGIPFEEENAAVIAITLLGELDDINALTGKLGNLPGVTARTAVSNALPGTRGRIHNPPAGSGRDILQGEDNHV
jgi:putative iron-only hydrogenase system regulator